MARVQRKFDFQIGAAIAWLAFTLTLAGWWLVFGLRQAKLIVELNHQQALELARHQRMLIWEGSILFGLILCGGAALISYIYQLRKRSRQIREFFATFSHETKTSIARLRLQAESLQEDLKDSQSPILGRLIRDTVRLELQLENSLFLAQDEDVRLIFESISLSETLENFLHQWPDIEFKIDRDIQFMADRRAVESIFKNIIQNSVIHGKAKKIKVTAETQGEGRITIRFQDDGLGLQGDVEKLGHLFHRHYSGSGSGLGLHIVRRLIQRMHGTIAFRANSGQGFCCELSFARSLP